eukprot:INCI13106.1.p1 GENE.INCI13106.1~~INCI13106.1.p1  ORF type:complete len:540 (+),score=80.32 INCI13106.1:207-1826(+)
MPYAKLPAAREQERRRVCRVVSLWLDRHCPAAKQLLARCLISTHRGNSEQLLLVDANIHVSISVRGSGAPVCEAEIERTKSLAELKRRIVKARNESGEKKIHIGCIELYMEQPQSGGYQLLSDSSLSLEAYGISDGTTLSAIFAPSSDRFELHPSIRRGCVQAIYVSSSFVAAANGRRLMLWGQKEFVQGSGGTRLRPQGKLRRITSLSIGASTQWVIAGEVAGPNGARAHMWCQGNDTPEFFFHDRLHGKAITATCVCEHRESPGEQHFLTVVTASKDGKALVWDLDAPIDETFASRSQSDPNSQSNVAAHASTRMATAKIELVGHGGAVNVAVAMPNSLHCLTGCDDGIVRMFSTKIRPSSETPGDSREARHSVLDFGGCDSLAPITALSRSADAKLILAGGATGTAWVFLVPDFSHGLEVERASKIVKPHVCLDGHGGVVLAVRSFASSHQIPEVFRCIVMANQGDFVRAREWSFNILQPGESTLLRTVNLSCFMGCLTCAFIAPDGRHAYTGSTHDTKLRVWCLRNGIQTGSMTV